jgi:hypothetical protein
VKFALLPLAGEGARSADEGVFGRVEAIVLKYSREGDNTLTRPLATLSRKQERGNI